MTPIAQLYSLPSRFDKNRIFSYTELQDVPQKGLPYGCLKGLPKLVREMTQNSLKRRPACNQSRCFQMLSVSNSWLCAVQAVTSIFSASEHVLTISNNNKADNLYKVIWSSSCKYGNSSFSLGQMQGMIPHIGFCHLLLVPNSATGGFARNELLLY